MPVFAATSTPDISQQTKQLAQWESAGIKNASDPKIKQLYEQLSKQISEYTKLEQEYISQLQENATAMKDKEQSTENKLLGAAAIGATGIGGMQLASGAAEMAADEDAEQAMRAYLATFHCNYGGGKNIPGGEQNVQLPAADLLDLRTQYINLANSLKIRKTSLDMRPGIESEAILDTASTGLYDDVAIGKTDGAFTSLARALTDKTSPDSTEWEQQKSESAKKTKTGGTIAAVGAVGGAVGNLIINKDAPKENSKKIKSEFEKKSRDLVSDIYATEKELSAAIEENKKKIAEYNQNLALHQEFAQTITQAECIEKFREYIDHITGLKPITDDFANTTDLNIKYDLNEQKNAYTQCVTDVQRTECESKANHAWENGTCVDKNVTNTTDATTEENPTIISTTDDEFTCIDRETNNKIELNEMCLLPDGRYGIYEKDSNGYCECFDMPSTPATPSNNKATGDTCLMTSTNKTYSIGKSCSNKIKNTEYQGILKAKSDGKCFCEIDQSKLSPETCTISSNKTVTQGQACKLKKDNKLLSGFYFKLNDGSCICHITGSQDTCTHNGRTIATGKACDTSRSDFTIAATTVRGSDGQCICQATQCKEGYKLTNGDCKSCADGYRRYEYGTKPQICQSIYCPRKSVSISTARGALTGYGINTISDTNACKEYCSNQYPVNHPETYDVRKYHPSNIWSDKDSQELCQYKDHMLTFNGQNCICTPDESDRQKYTMDQEASNNASASNTLHDMEHEQVKGNMLQNIKYYDVCGSDRGKLQRKTPSAQTDPREYCIDVFKNTQVQHLHAEKLAEQWALINHGQEIHCETSQRRENNQDYISCTAIFYNDRPYYYEFQFDDVKESMDDEIQMKMETAVCNIIYKGIWLHDVLVSTHNAYGSNNNLTDLRGCYLPSADKRPDFERAITRTFGGTLSQYDKSNRSSRDMNQVTHIESYSLLRAKGITSINPDQIVLVGRFANRVQEITLNKIANVDPRHFYNTDIQVQASGLLTSAIFDYLSLQIAPENPTAIWKFECGVPIQVGALGIPGMIDGQTVTDPDDVLTCTINNEVKVDFVFDDLSESWNWYSDAGYQNINCASLGGQINGTQCMNVNKTTCERIAAADAKHGLDGAYWDEAAQRCMLPAAAKKTGTDQYFDIAIMVGGVVMTVVVTIATFGTGTALVLTVLGIVGGAMEIESQLEIYNAIDNFLNESQNCREASCAQNMLKENLQRMSNLQDDMTDAQASGVDAELTRLAELIPTDSQFYKDVLAQGISLEENRKGFFDPDSWEPEQVYRAVGIVLQILEVGAALSKGILKLVRGANKTVNTASKVIARRALTNYKKVSSTIAKADDVADAGQNIIRGIDNIADIRIRAGQHFEQNILRFKNSNGAETIRLPKNNLTDDEWRILNNDLAKDNIRLVETKYYGNKYMKFEKINNNLNWTNSDNIATVATDANRTTNATDNAVATTRHTDDADNARLPTQAEQERAESLLRQLETKNADEVEVIGVIDEADEVEVIGVIDDADKNIPNASNATTSGARTLSKADKIAEARRTGNLGYHGTDANIAMDDMIRSSANTSDRLGSVGYGIAQDYSAAEKYAIKRLIERQNIGKKLSFYMDTNGNLIVQSTEPLNLSNKTGYVYTTAKRADVTWDYLSNGYAGTFKAAQMPESVEILEKTAFDLDDLIRSGKVKIEIQ